MLPEKSFSKLDSIPLYCFAEGFFDVIACDLLCDTEAGLLNKFRNTVAATTVITRKSNAFSLRFSSRRLKDFGWICWNSQAVSKRVVSLYSDCQTHRAGRVIVSRLEFG